MASPCVWWDGGPRKFQCFARLLRMGSAAPETYRHRGLALKDEGEFSKAVEELNKALERGASDIRSWRGLAEAQENLGNKTDAAKSYLGLAQALVAAGRMEDALAATDDSLRLNAERCGSSALPRRSASAFISLRRSSADAGSGHRTEFGRCGCMGD